MRVADVGAVQAWADGVFRARARSTRLLLRTSCPAPGVRRFTLLYAYFRWADDRVDVPDRGGLGPFVDRQAAVVAGRVAPDTLAEHALGLALDGPEGARLVPAARQMWAAIAFDARRGPAPIAAADLAHQVARVGDAYLGGLWACSGAPGTAPADVAWLSRGATAAHQLRDLHEDLGLGYCNVPAEFLAGRAPSGPVLAAWRAHRADELRGWFRRGRAALAATAPPWRTRLVLAALAHRYQRLLDGLSRGTAAPAPAPPG